jgi:hypothetical protein
LHADTHAQPPEHEYLGVGVDGAAVVEAVGVGVHKESEPHDGYAACSVDPQLSDTPRLMQSVSAVVPSKTLPKLLATDSTFQEARFALNDAAPLKACEPSHTRFNPD